jgi:hypothetical protein
MKQTSVDWFVKEVELISNSKRVSREEMIELYNQAIKQAKEMEKNQVINDYEAGLDNGTTEQDITGEQYYKEVYEEK